MWANPVFGLLLRTPLLSNVPGAELTALIFKLRKHLEGVLWYKDKHLHLASPFEYYLVIVPVPLSAISGKHHGTQDEWLPWPCNITHISSKVHEEISPLKYLSKDAATRLLVTVTA